MVAVHETVDKLSSLPLETMLEHLSLSRNQHGATPYTEYLARVSLNKHPSSSHITLPPTYQTLPHRFFSEEILETGTETDCISVLDPEQRLAWWREDPTLSEHHVDWHVSFPYTDEERG